MKKIYFILLSAFIFINGCKKTEALKTYTLFVGTYTENGSEGIYSQPGKRRGTIDDDMIIMLLYLVQLPGQPSPPVIHSGRQLDIRIGEQDMRWNDMYIGYIGRMNGQ